MSTTSVNLCETLTFRSTAASMSACGRSVSSAKNLEWRDHRNRRGGRWRAAGVVGNPVVRAGARRVSSAARRRRPPRSERDLAGQYRGQLRPRGAHGAAGDGAASRPVRPGARRCRPRARRGRLGPAGHGRGRRRTRFRTSRKRSPRRKRTRRSGWSAIPRSSATCRACRARPTCRSRSRFSRATSAIFFAYQYAGAVRNVYLKDPGPAPIDSWMGQSVAKWEGDTLVIDVDRLQRQHLVRSRRQLPQRGAARRRALHAHRAGRHPLRSDDRGSRDVHASLEDQPAALSPDREERAADGLQVRRVRRRAAVRPVPQEAAHQVGMETRDEVTTNAITARDGGGGSRSMAVADVGAHRGRPGGAEAGAAGGEAMRSRACPTAIPICRGCTTSRR